MFVFVSRKTAFGRSVFAIGGNATAAHLSGIKVRQHPRGAVRHRRRAGGHHRHPSDRAQSASGDAGVSRSGLEFDVIAAVVVGGTALTGGRGSMLGTLLGVFVITLIGNGLVLIGINPFFQPVVRGVIIVAAVLLNILALALRRPAQLEGR